MDLRLCIVAINNTLKKRMEIASRAAANFLNSSVFGLPGPEKSLARTLGAIGDHAGECLLKEILRTDSKGKLPIFPFSDSEASARPLVKNPYNPDLHLAIGMLRIFDAERNSLDGESQCNFHAAPYIQGTAQLDVYVPMFFEIAHAVMEALSPLQGAMFCKAKSPEQVAKVMQSTFSR